MRSGAKASTIFWAICSQLTSFIGLAFGGRVLLLDLRYREKGQEANHVLRISAGLKHALERVRTEGESDDDLLWRLLTQTTDREQEKPSDRSDRLSRFIRQVRFAA